MNKKQLEERAVALAEAGVSDEEIEEELEATFMFFRDGLTGKINHATYWRSK